MIIIHPASCQKGSVAIVDIFLIFGITMILILAGVVSSTHEGIVLEKPKDIYATIFTSIESKGLLTIRYGKKNGDYSLTPLKNYVGIQWVEEKGDLNTNNLLASVGTDTEGENDTESFYMLITEASQETDIGNVLISCNESEEIPKKIAHGKVTQLCK